jgi:hypothetical protein
VPNAQCHLRIPSSTPAAWPAFTGCASFIQDGAVFIEHGAVFIQDGTLFVRRGMLSRTTAGTQVRLARFGDHNGVLLLIVE